MRRLRPRDGGARSCADDFGDRGMLASELLPAIPRAMRIIREGKPDARVRRRSPADSARSRGSEPPSAGSRRRERLRRLAAEAAGGDRRRALC